MALLHPWKRKQEEAPPMQQGTHVHILSKRDSPFLAQSLPPVSMHARRHVSVRAVQRAFFKCTNLAPLAIGVSTHLASALHAGVDVISVFYAA